jgi:DNA-binding beta-propeller fold protein YncE
MCCKWSCSEEKLLALLQMGRFNYFVGLRLKLADAKINKLPSYPSAVRLGRGFGFCGGVVFVLAWLASSTAQAQITNYALGTTALWVGPAAGSNSVVFGVEPATGVWSATTNAPWLHLTLANQSGIGSTNVTFSYDANPGATRGGTLTIAGQTLTITQAGSTYAAAEPVTTLVSLGLASPIGVAVDASGNVYIADDNDNTITEWTASSDTSSTLISSGLSKPAGVAVGIAGNVYVADTFNNAIEEWTASNKTVSTLISSGLSHPSGVAVDGAGNVYIADTGNGAVKEWTAADSNVVTLVSSNLNDPSGVAVDSAGNIYIADTGNSAVKEWTAATSNLTTLVSGLNQPNGVSVDGSGNVYIADTFNNAIKEWTAANGAVTALVSPGLSRPYGVAVDSSGNVYIADTSNVAIKELPHAFVDSTPKLEGVAAGADALPMVLPPAENLLPPFNPSTDQTWLTINGITNGVLSFSFSANSGPNRVASINLLGQAIAVIQGGASFVLGTNALLVGPSAASNSVVLAVFPASATWTAMANSTWLHLSPVNQSGVGSTNVVFSYDANPGPTRDGTLTIGGQTFTVTQAGSTYVAVVPAMTTLVSNGLSFPFGVAVDSAGNVYIADTGHNAIQKWTAADNTLTPLVSSGLSGPIGVAVDAMGDVFIADTGNNAIEEWTPAIGIVTPLVSSGLSTPFAVAVDAAGNVYIADTGNDAIKEWTAASQTVRTLASAGLGQPNGVAVDAAGNVYIGDFKNNAIVLWTAANNTLTTLVPAMDGADGVAVDTAGNVYVADYENNTIQEWTAASGTVAALASSGLYNPGAVAVDRIGNIYIADTYNNLIKEIPYAFVDPTLKVEGLAAGNDSLPVVLPPAENLLPPFTPVSDQTWLTIGGITNGVVNYSFSASSYNRFGTITLLGKKIPIEQGGPSTSLGMTSLVVGPAAANNSVVLAIFPPTAYWSNTANAAWMHLSPANQSGTGGTNVVFSYDTNPGATRDGTLTIGGQTVTVTQAGSTYVAAQPLTTLVSNGLSSPYGVAVDAAGNVYVADYSDNAIKKWTAANNTLTPLVSSGLSVPIGVAVDGAGNVYIADSGNSAVKEWNATNGTVTTLVSSGLSSPFAVAVDGAGNVYIADTGNDAVKLWTAVDHTVTTIVSAGLGQPNGVAVDAAGNVYIGDFKNNAIEMWIAANNTLSTLVSGLNGADGVAVDGAGNVYVADYEDNTIKEWTAANGAVTVLVSSGLNHPGNVAVDSMGNVYITDSDNNALKELPYAFVDSTPWSESLAAGNEALRPVLPSTENLFPPFAPGTDQPWLTISGITNDAVSFSFTTSTSNRTAHIGLLGQAISVTQFGPFLATAARVEGPAAGIDSVVLAVAAPPGPWTATANATWLHVSPANQSGAVSMNVVFSYDANAGATRSGTLTIGGQTLTVTQAGSTYVATGALTTLVSLALNTPLGVALDGAGNAYIADTGNDAILEWKAAQDTVARLVYLEPNFPQAVALDGPGNVYFANSGDSAIEEWTSTGGNLITLVTNGLSLPAGLAVDGAGNVYIADTFNNAIKEWTAANSNVITLVSNGLSNPYGVAVDSAGNVYIADTGNNAVKEWTVGHASMTTLVSGLNAPQGVAVDASGNVYIADSDNYLIKEWNAASSNVTTLLALGSSYPIGMAVDGVGNIYFVQTDNNAMKELPRAFVDPTRILETAAAGNDVLPLVLPANENLLAPFAPTSDQAWLTISGITNNTVGFSFAANTGPSRTAHITLLGQTISITQGVIGSPPTITSAQILADGVLQFVFTNTLGASFTVLSTTNLSLSLSNWTVVGTASNTAPGQFQFTSQPTTNDSQRYYTVRSP